MLIIFFLGFSSGLPFLLTSGTLKIWLARENVDISTIGYFSWIGLSYSLKFLWAPFLDRFSFFGLGRRRSWMFLSQICIMIGIAVLGSFEPKASLQNMVIASILIAFFSATQDIAIDSFRREYLSEIEIGMGSSITQYGGRFAMLVSGGLGVGLVGSGALNLTWHELYYILAACMGIGMIVTFIAPEPHVNAAEQPRTMRDAVLEPLKEFLTRDKAVIILLFVMLFKFGDAMSGAMLTPYYVQMGYTNEDIGLIAKSFGLASALVGLFIGGVVIYSIGVLRSLWIFGVLQALSTAGFAIITWTGPEKWALAVTVFFEDISSGMLHMTQNGAGSDTSQVVFPQNLGRVERVFLKTRIASLKPPIPEGVSGHTLLRRCVAQDTGSCSPRTVRTGRALFL
ncbi:MAG: MFS transporter, partial [Bdellovibrionaceae bacterium]|nr:MFS transporter [Pseudobdellovibrionaceae bacterium]